MHLLRDHPQLRLTVIEKGNEVAGQQTGHNSGVIHSGIYYRPGSLKAEFCVNGRNSIVEFAEQHGIAYDRCGKLIIATDQAELPRLQTLYERGTANGVAGLEMVGPERIAEIEPHVTAIQALWSPATAIVDFAAITREYASQVRSAGGEVELGTRVTGVTRLSDSVVVHTSRGDREVKHLINCAGLHADRIASMMGVDHDLQIVPFRGEYYTLRKDREHLVRGLIYPVPDPDLPFLGVHFTRNVKGYVEAGPNAVLATAREGYRKRDFNLGDFAEDAAVPRLLARRDARVAHRHQRGQSVASQVGLHA